MNGRFVVALLVALIALPLRVSAQDARPQPLQELFLTEVVYLQDKGELQITLSSLLDGSSADRSALMTTAIEYGLTDQWQIGASLDGHTLFHHNPIAELRSIRTSIGTKYSFMNIRKSPVHLAFGFDLEFSDSGRFEESSEDELEGEPYVSMAVDVSRRISIFGTAGTSFAIKEAAALIDELPDDPGRVSGGGLIAFRYATIALEYTNRSDELPWRLDGSPLLTPSIVLHPGRNWELGAAMPVGTRTGARRPGLGLHLIKEF